MVSLLKQHLAWVLAVFVGLNLGVLLFVQVVVHKAKTEVLEEIQKDYSPSPYGPGINPDRVNLEAIHNQRMYFEVSSYSDGLTGETKVQQIASTNWTEDWDSQRGFIPEQ